MIELALELAPDARVVAGDDGALVVTGTRRRVDRAQPSAGERLLVERLASGPCRQRQLAAAFEASDGEEGLPRFYYLLTQLDGIGALSRVALDDGRALAALHPADGFAFALPRIDPTRRYRLSRFAYLARGERGLELLSPLGHARVEALAGEGVRVLAALANGGCSRELAAKTASAAEVVDLLLAFAASAGAIGVEDDEGLLDEERSETMQQWEFHDLLFHARSRLGRHRGGYGGTFRFRGRIPPLAALPDPRADSVPLPRPDLGILERDDPSFTAVLERRRSLREYGEHPITAAQLGELLFRVARVKDVRRHDDLEIAFYNYPAGGARSELTIYPLVDCCDGIAAGLHRYDAQAHALAPVAGPDDRLRALLGDAQTALQGAAPPQVLLLLAARFQRVSWKYESMAYAAILKHAGVVIQTIYLAATAMNLACCAVGGGDSDRFAAVAGTDYYRETTVGEIAVGSRRA